MDNNKQQRATFSRYNLIFLKAINDATSFGGRRVNGFVTTVQKVQFHYLLSIAPLNFKVHRLTMWFTKRRFNILIYNTFKIEYSIFWCCHCTFDPIPPTSCELVAFFARLTLAKKEKETEKRKEILDSRNYFVTLRCL